MASLLTKALFLVWWTHQADETIEPQVLFFKEALESLAKALIVCSQSEQKMSDYFKFNKISNEKVKDGKYFDKHKSKEMLDIESTANHELSPEELSKHERIYGQFKTISNFMMMKANQKKLIKLLFGYRILTIVVLSGVNFYLITKSLSVNQSEFDCEVNYRNSHPNNDRDRFGYVRCSILGVGVSGGIWT